MPSLKLSIEPLNISVFQSKDAEQVLDYFSRNKERFEPWNPTRDNNFYSLNYWQHRAVSSTVLFHEGKAAFFIAREKSKSQHSDPVIASCTLNHVQRGPLQSCFMGFAVDTEFEGKGVATELVKNCIEFAFVEWNLHRVQATHSIKNERSKNLLKKLGFQFEGQLDSYLLINQEWQDHASYSLLNPNWRLD